MSKSGRTPSIVFDKYDRQGAYHWQECDRWNRAFNPPLLARYDVVVDAVHGGEVLDIGAGDGYLTGRLAGRADRVVGLEYDEAGAGLARSLLAGRENCEIVRGSTYDLPFADNSFRWAVMADVIEHLDHPEVAVREVARVLKPDGSFVVTTPKKVPHRVWDKYHVKEYLPEELRDLLGTAFGSVRMSYLWPLHWSERYRTRIGWRGLKFAGRLGFNPFRRSGTVDAGFGQIFAVASAPRDRSDD